MSTTDRHPGAATPDGPLDLDALPIGTRLVVRHRLDADSGFGATDALGDLLEVTPTTITVGTRGGEVTVRRTAIILAKLVPPAPTRRGPAHLRIGIRDLHEVMADGWAAVNTDRLGDWLLRESAGFTSRANSALALGDPGVPVDTAIGLLRDWYSARGLPPQVQLPLAGDAAPTDDPLGAALVEAGWVARSRTRVMTAAAHGVPPLPEGVGVRVDAALSPFWLAAYSRQRELVPGVSEQVLTGSGAQLFLSVDGPGGEADPIAIARMSIAPGWAGLSCVWTDPQHRRAGHAGALTQAVAMLAREHRMPSIYLQVEADNAAAITLYDGLGFDRHSDYLYLRSR